LNPDTGNIEPIYERIKERAGEYYDAFVENLRQLGYTVEDKVYVCADYGDPTTRKRLFIRALRHDGATLAPAWARQTHAQTGTSPFGQSLPRWRTSRECIDLTRPGNSMINRKTQQVAATWKRVWQGFRQDLAAKGYELTAVTMPDCSKHAQPTDLPEVDEAVLGAAGDFLTDIAFTLPQDGRAKPRSMDDPISTVATAGAISVIQPKPVHPFIVTPNGERAGQLPRTHSIDKPMPTVACSNRFQMVAPKLQAFVTIQRKHGGARTLDEPLATITAGGGHHQVCEPFLIAYYGTGHAHSLDTPLPTQTTKARFALVTIRCTKTDAEDGFLLDFDSRMLWTDELAKGQGFPEGYQFAGNKTEQVKQIGNAVPVNTAKALSLAALEQILDEEKENIE
jgi:DNA (cytosine-5)-methyltransferase 1